MQGEARHLLRRRCRFQGARSASSPRRTTSTRSSGSSTRASARPTSTSSRATSSAWTRCWPRARKRQSHGLRPRGRGPARARPLHLPGPPQAAELQLPLLLRLLQRHVRAWRARWSSTTATRSPSIRSAPGPTGSRSGSAPRRWCSRRNPNFREEYYDARRPPPATSAGQAIVAAQQGQAPAAGQARRGLRRSRSRSRASSRSSTASTTCSSACRTSSPTSRSPNNELAAEPQRAAASRMVRNAGHGAHLLVLRR